jgi:hypothetical protein
MLGMSMRMKSLASPVSVIAGDDDLVDLARIQVADRALDQAPSS